MQIIALADTSRDNHTWAFPEIPPNRTSSQNGGNGQDCSMQVFAFPVVMLVRFWQNHHLLDLIQRPVWRVVKDRSRSYVNAILAGESQAQQGRLSSLVHGCPAHSLL